MAAAARRGLLRPMPMSNDPFAPHRTIRFLNRHPQHHEFVLRNPVTRGGHPQIFHTVIFVRGVANEAIALSSEWDQMRRFCSMLAHQQGGREMIAHPHLNRPIAARSPLSRCSKPYRPTPGENEGSKNRSSEPSPVFTTSSYLDLNMVQFRAIKASMADQLCQIIQDQILASVEADMPVLTRRGATLPPLKRKAAAVIGMRRAGKTSFLHQCRADLTAAGRTPGRLLYFNFEDERLGDMQAGQLHLIPDTHLRLFPEPADEPVTLFLDEIQRVPRWEQFFRRLLDTPGYELFLSGSSAKLLSREIATSMRGRAWEIPIHPFGFREFLRHHQKEIPEKPDALSTRKRTALDHHFANYLETGGFPEAQDFSAANRRQLLQGYIDVRLLRDVIERHDVTNVTALRWLVRRLLSSPAGLFSVTKFSADLKSQAIFRRPRAPLPIPFAS